MLHKVGTEYIETEFPEGRGKAKAAAAPSYDSWEALEQRLIGLGALPEAIQRVKADFATRDSTSIEVP